MESIMTKIYRLVGGLTLGFLLAQALPAMAQSRLPPAALMQPMPQLATPQFNTPGPQMVPVQPPAERLSPLPNLDPPTSSLGIR
jgi:hypothetical protein